MENKRSHPREPARTKVRLNVDDQWHDCVITNISSSGVRLYLRKNIAAGKSVRIQIGDLGQFDATVVWCEGDETGLHFDHDPTEISRVLVALAN